jgi:hypothetical protein
MHRVGDTGLLVGRGRLKRPTVCHTYTGHLIHPNLNREATSRRSTTLDTRAHPRSDGLDSLTAQ